MEHDTPESPDEQFVQLFAGHERHLRAFIRSMGLDWSAVDDVVQTVSLVMWRKWDQFDPDTDFMQWARGITRFEVLKFRRKMARDRHVFRDDVMELLADAAEELDSQASADNHRAALQQCLNSLPAKSGRLIRAAYEGDRTICDVAEDVGQSATAFYKTLDRIRKELARRAACHHRYQKSYEPRNKRESGVTISRLGHNPFRVFRGSISGAQQWTFSYATDRPYFCTRLSSASCR